MNSTAATLGTAAAEHSVRVGHRRKLAVAGRLTWRDSNGTLRFASVVTRDVSETDAFVVEIEGIVKKHRAVFQRIRVLYFTSGVAGFRRACAACTLTCAAACTSASQPSSARATARASAMSPTT